MKALWFDVETTGLDSRLNDIIQLGYQLEIDGNIVTKGDLRFRPINPNNIDQTALRVCNVTTEEIMQYPDTRTQYEAFTKDIDRFIDKYNPADKAYPCGYNVFFDYQFLTALPYKIGEKYGIGSYLNHILLDPLPILNNLIAFNAIKRPPDRKLETICKIFNIPLDPHDAASDINATRELFYLLMSKVTYNGENYWR